MNGNIDSLISSMEKLSPDSDTEISNIPKNNPFKKENEEQKRFSGSNEKTSSSNSTTTNNSINNNNKSIINNPNNNYNNHMFNVHGTSHHPNERKFKSYKLISDPFLKKGAPKQYRYDGNVSSKEPIIQPKDPRPFAPLRPNVVKEPMVLLVPRFKIDKNYVAEPPSIEVSITNLNDNINNTFLEDLLKKFGAIEEIEIFYHPKTNKHLGLAKIIFMTPSGARACVNKLNKTSVMGNIIDVFLDPFANKINQIYDSILNPSSTTNITNENLNNFIDPNRINEFGYDISNNNNEFVPNLSTSSFENSTPFNFSSSNINNKQYYDNTQGIWKSSFTNSEGDKSPIRESLESRIQGLNLKGFVFLDDPTQETNFSLPNLISNDNNYNNDEYPFQRRNFQKAIDKSDAILNTPPSPFSSASEYLKWHQFTKEMDLKIAMDNNKMNNNEDNNENRRLKKNYRYNENYYDDNDENDSRMSLSSLSSGEKLENNSLPHNNNVFGILPLIPGFANWDGNFKPINNSIGQPFMYNSFLQNNAQSFGQHFSGFNSSNLKSLNDSFNKLEDDDKKNQVYKYNKESLNDLSEKILEESLKEFKAIIVKDIYKKIVENFSFKLFDQWWENSEKESNENCPNNSDTVSDVRSSRTEINIPFFNHVNFERSIQNMHSSLSQNFNEYGVSRGLKAAMVKMPSFKKKKPKSPVRTNDRLSDISDEDDYIRRKSVQGSARRYKDGIHNKHDRSLSPDSSYSSRNRNSSLSSSSNYSDSSKSESETDDYDQEDDTDDEEEDEEEEEEGEEEEEEDNEGEEVSDLDEETIQKEEVVSKSDEEESDATSQSKTSLSSTQSSNEPFVSLEPSAEIIKDESGDKVLNYRWDESRQDFVSDSDCTDTADEMETETNINNINYKTKSIDYDPSKIKLISKIKNRPNETQIAKRYDTAKNDHNFTLNISPKSDENLMEYLDEAMDLYEYRTICWFTKMRKNDSYEDSDDEDSAELSDVSMHEMIVEMDSDEERNYPPKRFEEVFTRDYVNKLRRRFIRKKLLKKRLKKLEEQRSDNGLDKDDKDKDSNEESNENLDEESSETSVDESSQNSGEDSIEISGEESNENLDEESNENSDKELNDYWDDGLNDDWEEESSENSDKELNDYWDDGLNDDWEEESIENSDGDASENSVKDSNLELTKNSNIGLKKDMNTESEKDLNKVIVDHAHNNELNKNLNKKRKAPEDFPTVASEMRKAKIKNICYNKNINNDLHLNNNEIDSGKISKSEISEDKFKKRDFNAEQEIIYEFEKDGIDAEDISYLKRRYKQLLQEENDNDDLSWINDVHWVDHPPTFVPPPKKKRKYDDTRIHKTGCARSEGYYKVDRSEKLKYLVNTSITNDERNENNIIETRHTVPQQSLREARSNQRRLINMVELNDLPITLNKLEFRKKKVKFAKSKIHVWGLFAMQHIPQHEFVIEYIGQQIRPMLADLREKKYGTGSSYLFKIDSDTIIDATDSGNVARFINHSCNPNCYAKVILLEGQKRIVIYSKQAIEPGQEITYDYKFPIENDKIPCLCGSQGCRGFLN